MADTGAEALPPRAAVPDAGGALRGVLFDVDGTLVDTTYLHAVCWAEALRQHGHVVPAASVHHAIGMGAAELLGYLLGEHTVSADEQAALHAAHHCLYQQYWGRLQPLPGAPELLRQCARAGLRVVLASSASAAELAALRSALGADDAVTAATSSSDAAAGKPEPDIVQSALRSADLTAAEAVLVGDAVWDGLAAARAGLPFVGLSCGGTAPADLRSAGAIEVWTDPADLLAHLHDSLLGAASRP